MEDSSDVEQDATVDTIKQAVNIQALSDAPSIASQLNASMFPMSNVMSPRRVAIIDSENVKDVAMNILDQSLSSFQDNSRLAVFEKQMEFLAWETHQKEQR